VAEVTGKCNGIARGEIKILHTYTYTKRNLFSYIRYTYVIKTIVISWY